MESDHINDKTCVSSNVEDGIGGIYNDELKWQNNQSGCLLSIFCWVKITYSTTLPKVSETLKSIFTEVTYIF